MSVLHAPGRPEVNRRLLWFPLVTFFFLLVLTVRLWTIQITLAPQLLDEAYRTRAQWVESLAPRGTIYDRNGLMLAGVKKQYVVTAQPKIALETKGVVPRLASLLNLPVKQVEDELKEGLWRPNMPVALKAGVSIEKAAQIAESGGLDGADVDERPMRRYTDTTSFTHILGYVWTPNEKDVQRLEKQGLKAAEYVGKSGIERAYEATLMGKPARVEVVRGESGGNPLREEAIPGSPLYLTIDTDLQRYASAVFKQRGYRGAVVAIDPRDGGILAMVSAPTFDTSIFDGGLTYAEKEALDRAPGKPQFNRAVSSAIAPGSTMKIVTSMAGYRSGKLRRGTTYFCNGGYSQGRGRPIRCMGTHGGIGFYGAMSRSCNAYFCNVGVRAGSKIFLQTALDVGLGRKTGVENTAETAGIVPTEEWRNKYNPPRPFGIGDLANCALGQGYIAATPIQMANLAALVANNGIAYQPHFELGHLDTTTNEFVKFRPKIHAKFEAEPWFWDMLKDGLSGVITSGTARSAYIPGVNWAGKTGSAEHGRKNANRTHAWFVGFAPRKNPKIAICVFGESVGHGGDAAAPVAREIVSHYLFASKKQVPEPWKKRNLVSQAAPPKPVATAPKREARRMESPRRLRNRRR